MITRFDSYGLQMRSFDSTANAFTANTARLKACLPAGRRPLQKQKRTPRHCCAPLMYAETVTASPALRRVPHLFVSNANAIGRCNSRSFCDCSLQRRPPKGLPTGRQAAATKSKATARPLSLNNRQNLESFAPETQQTHRIFVFRLCTVADIAGISGPSLTSNSTACPSLRLL